MLLIITGVCLDLLHDPRTQDQAVVHGVRAGAPPGVRLRPHRGVRRAHNQPADHGQVLWLQAAPPSHCH